MLRKLKQLIKDLGSFGPLLAFAVLAPGLGVIGLTASSDHWLPIYQTNGFSSLILFMISGTLLAGLSLIPTHAVSLIGGMLFGSIYGSGIATFTIILASIISYYAACLLVKDQAVQALRARPQAEAVYNELLKSSSFQSIIIISLIRLSPIMPFAGTNVLLAAAKVKLKDFLIGSIIGLAPRIIIVVIAGSGLEKLDLKQKGSQELLIVGIVATVLIIMIIGKLSQKALKRTIRDQQSNTL